MTYKIFLRTDQTNLDGTNTVCLRLTQNRKSKLLSLRLFVKQKDWSETKEFIKKTDPKFVLKNKYLRKYNNKAENIISDYFLNDKYLSFAEFKKNFFNNSYGTNSFYEFIENELKYKSGMYGKYSLTAYRSQLKKLKGFRSELSFAEIDISFLQAYETVLKSKHKKNTIYKALSFIKTYINKAIKENVYTNNNPFNNYKLSRNNGQRAYLTIFEVEKLEKLYINKELEAGAQNVLRYFLFTCFTGLRFADIKTLIFGDLQNEVIKGKEIKVIEVIMGKTDKPVRIPVNSKAKLYMPEENSKEKNIFKVFTNQVTNRHLKTIAKAVNIEKKLSFHVSRHTLATNELEYGIPLEVISSILGHSSTKITQIYAKVSDNLRVQEMQKME